MNSSFKDLLNRLAQRPKVVERYQPKFTIGDFVLTKYKGMLLICQILDVLSNEDDKIIGDYMLRTVFNTTVKQKLFKRTQNIQVIDKYYDLIKPETAQVLYGIDLEKLAKEIV